MKLNIFNLDTALECLAKEGNGHSNLFTREVAAYMKNQTKEKVLDAVEEDLAVMLYAVESRRDDPLYNVMLDNFHNIRSTVLGYISLM